jgi:hypothetical protein
MTSWQNENVLNRGWEELNCDRTQSLAKKSRIGIQGWYDVVIIISLDLSIRLQYTFTAHSTFYCLGGPPDAPFL